MPDEPVDDDKVTLIETIVEDGDWVIHQWRDLEGNVIEEYCGLKRVVKASDLMTNLYAGVDKDG